MYFKFNTKKEALDFCLLVNKEENINITEENTTLVYAEPIIVFGFFYVIADEITSKYTDLEPIDLFSPVDATPPQLTGYGVVIPTEFLWAFPNNKFILHGTGFEIPLTIGSYGKAVDAAYLVWKSFLTEIWKPENKTVFDILEPVWLYCETEAENNRVIQL